MLRRYFFVVPCWSTQAYIIVVNNRPHNTFYLCFYVVLLCNLWYLWSCSFFSFYFRSFCLSVACLSKKENTKKNKRKTKVIMSSEAIFSYYDMYTFLFNQTTNIFMHCFCVRMKRKKKRKIIIISNDLLPFLLTWKCVCCLCKDPVIYIYLFDWDKTNTEITIK